MGVNRASAARLRTPRNINGVPFDGTQNVTIPGRDGLGQVGTYAMLRNNTTTTFTPGMDHVVSSASLTYSNAAGNVNGDGGPPAFSIWRCLGYAASNTGTGPERVCLWFRTT